MDDTSITIERAVKQRLQNHRHPNHENWSETLVGMMEMLPTVEDIEEGCVNCGKEPFGDVAPEEWGGIARWFSTEVGGSTVYNSNYFCSPECAAEQAEEIQNHVPETPDKVIVGGKAEMRTEFEGASFYIDGETMKVGLPVPGAFGGTSSHGNEYDYIGEPVYVYHEGDYRQHGIIEDIIHEEVHTALLLGHDAETVMLNHPDDERREEYEEQHAKWTGEECAACGEGIRFMVEEPPEECPHCDAAEW